MVINKTSLIDTNRLSRYNPWIGMFNDKSDNKIVKKKNKRKTTKDYIEELEQINPYIVPIEEYVNSKTPILHYHKSCGHITKMAPTSALRGSGCILCKGKKIGKSKSMGYSNFVNSVRDKNSNIEILSNTYTNSQQKVECRCKICGHKWLARASHLLAGHGCPICAHAMLANKAKKPQEIFLSEMQDINPYVEILDDYISTHTKVKCLCKICGYIWNAEPSKLLVGKGCPACNEPLGERNIRIFLDKRKIKYILYKKYENLRGVGGKPLSYDFYLCDYNLLIEFQGKQHQEVVEYFGGEKAFEIQKEHDKRKREYAVNNNINFLEIWYYDIDNTDLILNNYLNNLKLETVETTGTV